ncbi:MAG: glycosyltransferase [Myxococcales bacterium]|nr:glycosyltransferase [Myxococcales bacterium]
MSVATGRTQGEGDGVEPLLVVYVESPNRGGQGDSVYRVVQPSRALAEVPGVRVVTGSWLSPALHALLPLADVVVLADVVEADLLPLVRQRQAAGLATIYEINDDFQAPQPWNPTAYLAQNPLTRSLSSLLAARSDGVQFSTPHLRDRFGFLNPRGAVFVNQLWDVPARAPKPPGLRLGWGGSLGHMEDFRSVVPAVKACLEAHPALSFHVMGAEVFRELCGALPAGRWTYQPGGSLAAYLAFVDSLHIGLCPLEDTDFNRGRSDVKFLEYASRGVVTLAADREPYRHSLVPERTGFVYRDVHELPCLVARLVAAPDRRQEVAVAAYAYVTASRRERPAAAGRLAFWRSCLAGTQDRAAGTRKARHRRAEAALATLAQPFGDVPVFLPPAGALETALLEGLALLRDGRTKPAQAGFAAATRLAPSFYVPWLYLGRAESDETRARAALAQARTLAPFSVAAWMVEADREAAAAEGQGDRLVHALREADRLAPELGVPAARLAELAGAAGALDEALALERRALAANPYYAPPHARRALRALDGHNVPAEVEAALERCARADERFWMTRFAQGRLALARGDVSGARVHLEAALRQAPDRRPVWAQLARVAAIEGRLDDARDWLAKAKAQGS